MNIKREVVQSDVTFVGGGPACLAGAIHLQNLIDYHNEKAEEDPTIQSLEGTKVVILEKGSEIGSHGVSGAVLDPRALRELIPDWQEREDFPLEWFVEREQMILLTENSGFSLPVMPPELNDHGKPIVSISKFQRWLGDIASDRGIEVLPGTAGWNLLYDEKDQVNGVRTRDRGLDSHGKPKEEYEPGADVLAKVTIIGEGPRGHLSRILFDKYNLQSNRNEMTYEMGCKEVLEFPKGTIKDGFVYLLAGYPLAGSMGMLNATFGGAFIYSMADDKACIGLLAVLDAKDPDQDVQYLLQKLKLHPRVKKILKGGKVIKYGAKAVTVGGWGCMPQLYAPGAMVVGDSASFLDAARIKGIHLSMKSGMLAAETAFKALLLGDYSEETLSEYKRKIDDSWVREEMEVSQNFHTNISMDGLPIGSVKYGLAKVFGAGKIRKAHEDHEGINKLSQQYKSVSQRPQLLSPGRYADIEYDGEYIIDKLSAVYLSATTHDEHQPCHLRVEPTIKGFSADHCIKVCTEEYGNPCERFCPAQVYNIVDSSEDDIKAGAAEKRLQVDFSNCVHCKTCDIRDPYQIIQWVPPEGGEGPEYDIL